MGLGVESPLVHISSMSEHGTKAILETFLFRGKYYGHYKTRICYLEMMKKRKGIRFVYLLQRQCSSKQNKEQYNAKNINTKNINKIKNKKVMILANTIVP